jgi:hypothetical protein
METHTEEWLCRRSTSTARFLIEIEAIAAA